MPLFPVFLDLSDAAVLVVGEGAEADRKAASMVPFCRTVLRSPYPPVPDTRPALVILAEPNHPDNEALADKFREARIPVNVADRPELCDFRFPSLITRGDLSIGIATNGKAPAFGALLRRKIEDALPDDLESLLNTAAALTTQLRETIPDQHKRARILREALQKLL